MGNEKKARKFFLYQILLTYPAVVLSRVFLFCHIMTSSDVSFTGSDSLLKRFVPDIFKYGNEIILEFAVAAAIAAVVYAVTAMGKRQGVIAASLYIGAVAVKELSVFIWNVAVNMLEGYVLLAGIISILFEILIQVVLILIVFFIAALFYKYFHTSKRSRREKLYSKQRALFFSVTAIFIIHLIDLVIDAATTISELKVVSSYVIASVAGNVFYTIFLYFGFGLVYSRFALNIYKNKCASN